MFVFSASLFLSSLSSKMLSWMIRSGRFQHLGLSKCIGALLIILPFAMKPANANDSVQCSTSVFDPTANDYCPTTCRPFRYDDFCEAEESFLDLVKARRNTYTTDPQGVFQDGHWYHIIEDKLAAKIFAEEDGIPMPELLFCSEDVNDILSWPTQAADPTAGIVIKGIGLHSGKGVFVLPNGIGGVELLSGNIPTAAQIVDELSTTGASRFIIEEYVSGTDGAAIPNEYKIHMFNGNVGSIIYTTNRGTTCACFAEFDEDWNRLDTNGCFRSAGQSEKDPSDQCTRIDFSNGRLVTMKGLDFCTTTPARPDNLDEIIATAKAVSERIGAYIRVDLLTTADDTVVVNEFTPGHTNGRVHCSSRIDGNGCVDSCFLGRMWKDNSPASTDLLHGGSATGVPTGLLSWSDGTWQDKCTAFLSSNNKDAQLPRSSPVCEVCGQGLRVQNADVVLDNLGALGPVSCGELEQQGLNGQIDTASCGGFPGFVQDACDCQPIGPTTSSRDAAAVGSTTPELIVARGRTIPPSLTFAECKVCGEGMEVTFPDIAVTPFDTFMVSCAELQNLGAEGLLDPMTCTELKDAVEPCGCAPIGTPLVPTTPAPVAPVAPTTSSPSMAGGSPIPPSLTFAECKVCGEGMEVTFPDITITVFDTFSFSCAAFQILGAEGFIDPMTCTELKDVVEPCGCAPIGTPLVPTTPAPVAPVAPTTSSPSMASGNPILLSSTFPECKVCGEGLNVTLPGSVIQLAEGQAYSCAELELLGAEGFVDPMTCALLPALSSPCGCE